VRDGHTLTLELRGLRRRAAVRMMAATGGSIAGLARTIEFVAICAGWVLLPVWPVVAAAVAGDPRYLRRYPRTLVQTMRHIRATWRGRAISRMLVQRLTPPGLRVRERIIGSCTHCGNCCLDRSCLFLAYDAQGQSRCRIYGGRVWKRLTCGRYPVDGEEIALYRCPSFTAERETPTSGRRIVPIVRANDRRAR